jgi:MYXO-CTERM domain-containing protein
MLGLVAAAVISTMHLEGEVVDDGNDYVLVEVTVPAGTQEIEIAHGDGSPDNILDFGVWSPEGFRGYGGDLGENTVIGVDAASRGYLPGPITPGTWHVLVGKAKIAVPPAHYVIDVTFRDAPTLAPQTRAPWQPVTLADAPGWYAGDLHVHSRESGDARASFQEIHDLAVMRGLDFVVISDHNTTSHLDLLPVFQAGVGDLLFVRGCEVTTYGGHADAVGLSAPIDWRVGLGGRTAADVVGDAAAQDTFFIVNHPALDIGDVCIGCAWSHADTPWALVGGIEIQTGPYAVTGPIFTYQAMQMWDEQLDQGRLLVAVGGSDDHDAGKSMGSFSSPIGSPTTVIFAEALSEAALLEGLAAGRVVVKLRGPDDPLVELEIAGDDGVFAPLGSTVTAREVTLRVRVAGASGRTVRLFADGAKRAEAAVTSADFTTTFTAVPETLTRYRATLSDENGGDDVVVTNHVFAVAADQPPADDDGAGCGCAAAGRTPQARTALPTLAAAALLGAAIARRRRRRT